MTIEELTKHNDYFFEKASKIAKCESLAAELVQEMYLKLLKIPKEKIERYNGLKYGAVRMMNQIYISKKRSEKHYFEEFDEHTSNTIEPNNRHIYRSIVGKLLWEMPKNERYIFYLYHVKGLTLKALTESTGITKRTIEYSLWKATKIAAEAAQKDQKTKQLLRELDWEM